MDRKAFARRITEARTKAKLSQEKAAKKAGVSRNAIGQYENEQARPRVDQLIKLCETYKANPLYLLTGEGSPDWVPGEGGRAEQERLIRAVEAIGRYLRADMEAGRYVSDVVHGWVEPGERAKEANPDTRASGSAD